MLLQLYAPQKSRSKNGTASKTLIFYSAFNVVYLTDALAVVDALRLLTPNALRCSTLSIAGDKEGSCGCVNVSNT